MRHLDDGQIAELIDTAERRTGGPTDRRIGGPADRDVEAHVSECGVCRERVEEARQIAERARSILATAVPAPSAGAAVPPFEEILHRAGRAGRSSRGGGRLRWLAWAATVVVAGGLGWYARGQLLVSPRTAAPALNDLAVVETDSIAPLDQERRAYAADAPTAGNERPESAVAPGVTGRMAQQPPARQEAAAGEEFAVRDRAGADEGKVAAPPVPSAPLPSAVAQNAAEGERRARELALRRTPPAEAEQAPAAVVTAAERADALDRRLVVVSREEAENVVGDRLAVVQGIPVETYYVLPAEPGVVQTDQRLPTGGKLELEQWRASNPRSQAQVGAVLARKAQLSADSAIMAAESVQVDGLKIIARAPIPTDSLRALLRRLRR